MSRDILVPDRLAEQDIQEYVSLLWTQLSQINQGRTANKGTITLTANAATTTVDHASFESTQIPLFTALTSNAAAEVATMYVSARAEKQFTITHANNAQTDRDFEYVFVG